MKTPTEHIIKIDLQNFQIPATPKVPIKQALSPRKLKKKLPKAKKNKTKKLPKKVKPKQPTLVKKIVKIKKKSKKKQVKSTKKPKILAPSEMVFIENPLMLNSSKQGQSVQTAKIIPSPRIKKLYGKSFDHFTVSQQKFIVDKLDEIHRITQQTLSSRGYPSGALAAKTGQEGVNIVSFDLHPNGDISNLRLLQKVGYRALDENTLETIRTAYKDYPYPQEVTKIIFYVEYSIFGY